MKSILFISFDFKKDDYPAIPYSIAVLIGLLQKHKVKVGHYSFDLRNAQIEAGSDNITSSVERQLKANEVYFRSFNYVAISFSAWSIEYCKIIMELLNDFDGKIILGGYEVTSLNNEELINTFPRADFFIKGYAETALKQIICEDKQFPDKVIDIPVDKIDLVSPYTMRVLNPFTKKVHWETKRGCPYRCGFCEWGNASRKVYPINPQRLFDEIEIFRQSAVSEINILDGTFNCGKGYTEILRKLLELENTKITMQARFENLFTSEGKDFLDLCQQFKERIHLEFGLQTIHENEMEIIGRKGDRITISDALQELNKRFLDFEVSIIYAIPGQTVVSLIETIEFLLSHGCTNIKAYQLRIAKNSKLEEIKNNYLVKERKDKLNIAHVNSSFSFSETQKLDMDNIVQRLNSGELINHGKPNNEGLTLKYISPDLSQIVNVHGKLPHELITRVLHDYYSNTAGEIGNEDFRQLWLLSSNYERYKKDWSKYTKMAVSQEITLELQKWSVEFSDDEDNELGNKALKQVNQDLVPKKYICRALISSSGNYYIYRDIELTSSVL